MKQIQTKTFTFQRAHNYGAALQMYALQQILTKLGYSNLVVDNNDQNIFSWYRPLGLKNLSIKGKIKKIIKYILLNKSVRHRYKNFNNFIENHIKLTDKINTLEELNNIIEPNDILITGSDQVWNSTITKGLSDYYTLNFKKAKNNKKISYAASIGDSTLIRSNKEEYKKKISQLTSISVRESDAQTELAKIVSNKKIDIVLDPTLLLSKKEWESKIKNFGKIKSNYIFAYVVDKDIEFIKIVNEISKITGLGIIHAEAKNPGFNNCIGTIYEKGPLDFINYIKNADFVITTSFHATVFSIIFQKKFWTIPHRKTGARVTDLLNSLQINDRIIYDLEDSKNNNIKNEINYKNVQKILDQRKEESIEWLKNAIEK